MYRKLPPISETADELRELMRREQNAKKRDRLRMLYLLVSGQASSRKEVAQQLGVYRETVRYWLDAYVAGGIEQLLTLHLPAGRSSSLSTEALSDLKQALSEPKGFGSYDEIRLWLFERHGVEMKTGSVGNLVRARFGGKAKVPRPTPKKTKQTPSKASKPPLSSS
jgi:transposase